MAKDLLHSISQLPGPKGLPILGNLLQLDLSKLHLILEKWSDVYGCVYKFKMLTKTVVAISNPALVHNVLRERPETYRRISTIELAARELGTHGVFTAEGEQWKRERYVTVQAFKSEYLKCFFPEMLKITKRLHKRWSISSNAGLPVDIKDNWMRFTIDLTTSYAIGYDINLLENERNNFQQHLDIFRAGLNRRTSSPFPYWRFFKFPVDRALDKSLAVLKKTIGQFIEETRQRLENENKNDRRAKNFLEALLLSRDEEGKAFSYEEVQGNIFDVLVAGEDTTGHTLSWIVYFMTEHPEVQSKMQVESDTVLGEEVMPSDIDVLEQLNYIQAVIHETMRLKSAAPLLCMETNMDVNLDGLMIPKATPVMLINRHGALQEENFTDAHHFKPERWLGSKLTGCNHNRNASLPFGSGPRFCPGHNLAMQEMKMAIAMICKNFTVTRVDVRHPVQEVFSFMMMPDKLMVKFEKR